MKPRRRFGLGPSTGDALRKVGFYTSIPIMMVVGPLLGWWLGAQAERHWGGAPWVSAAGAILGLLASVRQVIRILKEAEEPPSRADE